MWSGVSAGLGVTIAGAVEFNASAQNLTSWAVGEVQKTTDLVLNVTKLLSSANSTGSSLDYNFPRTPVCHCVTVALCLRVTVPPCLRVTVPPCSCAPQPVTLDF